MKNRGDIVRGEIPQVLVRVGGSLGAAGIIASLFFFCRASPSGLGVLIALGSLIGTYSYYVFAAYNAHSITEKNVSQLVVLFVFVALVYILLFASYYESLGLVDFRGEKWDALFYSSAVFTTLGDSQLSPGGVYGKIFVMAESLMGMTHMVSFLAIFLTKFTNREAFGRDESDLESDEEANDDFATRKQSPTASEYLSASEESLIDRLNRNPGGLDSELPFMHSVISIRTAADQRKSNQALLQQTKFLVYATWSVCLATIVAVVINTACAA